MAGINFIEDGEFTPPLKFRNEIINHQKQKKEYVYLSNNHLRNSGNKYHYLRANLKQK